MTALHLEPLEALCDQWHTYQTTKLWLDEDPDRRWFETEKGYQQESPMMRSLGATLSHLQKLWAKFGLTPHAGGLLGSRGKAKPARSELSKFADEKTRDDEAMRP